MSFFSRTFGRAGAPLHVAAHSHHPWPDVSYDAQLAAWEDAARLLVTGHMMSDHAISTNRYTDQMFTPELIKKTSDFVIRASGLNAWTEGIKKAFTMEMLGYVARNSDRALADLDAPLRSFMDRYKISAAEWDRLRQLPTFDFRGAKRLRAFRLRPLCAGPPGRRRVFVWSGPVQQ